MPDMKTVDGIPIERARVMPDPAAIDIYYAKIAELIDGIPREFVLNMDETGFSDHVDAREEKRGLWFRQHICMRRFLFRWIAI
jgi:hypothetical protein